jgi:hypothetical protein
MYTVDWAGGGDFLTIQAGVDAAAYGDTVCVLEGVYNERVIMNDGVALLGEGADCTVIDGAGYDYSTVTCNGPFSRDTIIEGFWIRGGTGPGWSASGVWLGLECSATVRYNVITDNRMGVMVNYNNGDPLIDHNTIVYNEDCGIQIYVGNETIVTGVATIMDNIVGENYYYGIYRGSDSSAPDPPAPIVDYNDVYWNGILNYRFVAPGSNDFSLDPMFCMPPTDMRIDAASPCAGTGTGGSDRGALPAGCEPVAVEDKSWGAIKAMYR